MGYEAVEDLLRRLADEDRVFKDPNDKKWKSNTGVSAALSVTDSANQSETREPVVGPEMVLQSYVAGLTHLMGAQVRRDERWLGWPYADPTILVEFPAVKQLYAAVETALGKQTTRQLSEKILAEAAVNVEMTAKVLLLLCWLKTTPNGNVFPRFRDTFKTDFDARITGAVDYLFDSLEPVPDGGGYAVRSPYLIFRKPYPPFFLDHEVPGKPPCPMWTVYIARALREVQRAHLADRAFGPEKEKILDGARSFVRRHGFDYVKNVLEREWLLGQTPVGGWTNIMMNYRHLGRDRVDGATLLTTDQEFAEIFSLWSRFSDGKAPGINTHYLANRRNVSAEATAFASVALFDSEYFGLMPVRMGEQASKRRAMCLSSLLQTRRGPLESTLHPSNPILLAHASACFGVNPYGPRIQEVLRTACGDLQPGAMASQYVNYHSQLINSLEHMHGIYRIMNKIEETGPSAEYWDPTGFGALDRIGFFMSKLKS